MSYLSDCLTACDVLVSASCEHDANVVLYYFQGEVLKTGDWRRLVYTIFRDCVEISS